ncbi:AMP-binding protein [Aeromicrobium sp.]|uniref:AMP-binding protein n=2 Tax=Aeromicrobium sp. TaxID=1871063 RepID=UPI003563DB4E
MTSSSPTTLLRALRDLDLPDHPEAVVVDGRALSRAGLREVAVAFASRLPDAGPVAVCAEPTLETVVAVSGCLLAGVPVVPVPPDAGPAETAHVVTDSGATCWAGPPREGVDLPLVEVPTSPTVGDRRVDLPDPVAETETAIVLYTSGTTGAPKGVVLSHRALRTGIEGLADAWGWTGDDVEIGRAHV